MIFENLFDKNNNQLMGPLVITPDKFIDSRGCFFESWNKNKFDETLKKSSNIKEDINFVQDNQSYSKKGVIRGLHYQLEPYAQGKLVSCIEGEIFDVLVDIRKNSNTFGLWAGLKINSENNKQIWIPRGFAHGFLALMNNTKVLYKTTNYWFKQAERTILWNDPSIGIDWPLVDTERILSVKDNEASLLNEIEDNDLF